MAGLVKRPMAAIAKSPLVRSIGGAVVRVVPSPLRRAVAESGKEYVGAVWGHWKWLAITLFLGAVGTVQVVRTTVTLPAWAWFLAAGIALVVAQFLAFHDMRVERDEARELIQQLQATPEFPNVVIQAHPPLFLETEESTTFPGERQSLFVIPLTLTNKERDLKANLKFECHAEVPKPFPHDRSLQSSWRHRPIALPDPLKLDSHDMVEGDLYFEWSHAMDDMSFGKDVSEEQVITQLELRLSVKEYISGTTIDVGVPGMWSA